MGLWKTKVPDFYLDGMRIEAQLARYKCAKEGATKTLRLLSYLISDISGKIGEIDIQLSGDSRLEVTFIKLPLFLFEGLILNDKNIKTLKEQVIAYNRCAKENRLSAAKSILIELKEWLGPLKDEKAHALYIASEDIQRTAHTPIVITRRASEKSSKRTRRFIKT